MSNSTAPADGAPPEDGASSKLWIVGVLISIVATVGSNGGINLQKVSIMKELAKPRSQQRAYVLQPLWLLGFIGVVVGALGDFGSLAFAPQSLLIPLGGLTLLFNIWFARLCLGERTSRRDLIATMFLLVGVVMITVTGSKTGHNYTISELKALFGEPPFIGYIIVVGACMGALYWYQRYCANLRRQFGPWSKQYTRVHKSHVFSLPLLAGLFAAQTIWAAKAVVEMVKTTALGDNQFVYFGFYALLATTVTLVLAQLHFLSRSLEHAPALIAVPIFQSVLIVGSIIGGGVLYKELSGLSGVEIGLFMVGLFVMLFGMWLLSKRKLEGPVPPSKLFLYATIARFIVRTRTTLRQQEAEKWPNRLHLYSCTCDCHLLVLHGERAALRLSSRLSGVGKSSGSLEAALASLGGAGTAPAGGVSSSSAALAGPGHRVLETIQDAGEEEDEDCDDEDNDALDYALAKRERERVSRASGTYEPPSSAASASWSRGSPGTAAAAAPDSLRSAPGPRALSARHLAALADAGNGGISSVMVGGPVHAVGAASAVLKDNASPTTATVPNPMISAAPGGGPGSQRHGSHPGHRGAAVSDVDMRFYCEGHASLGRQHGHAPQASAGAFPAGGGNDGYINADGSPAVGAAEDPSLPPMCPRCCCRVTPVSVLSARKTFLMSKPAAEALVAALNHIGTGSAGLDSGAKGPGSFASGAAPGAGAGLRTGSGESLASGSASSSARHLMAGGLSASSIGRGEDWDRTLAAVTAEESSRGRQTIRRAGMPPLSAVPAGTSAESLGAGSAVSVAASARPGIEVPGAGGTGGLASLTGGPLSAGGAGAGGGPLSVGSTAALMPDGRESVRSVRVAVAGAGAGGSGADAAVAAGGAPRAPILSQERRGSRAVTKEQVAAVMSSMQQRSRSSIAGLPMPAVLPLPSLSFYDASNPAVPSFMAVPTPAPASHAALQQGGGAAAGEGGMGGSRGALVLSSHGGGAAAAAASARSPPLSSGGPGSGSKPRSATFSGLDALGSGGAAGSGGQGSAGSSGGDRGGSFALSAGPAPGPGHHLYRTSSAEGGGKASGARGVELAVAAPPGAARPGRARAGTAGAGGGVVWRSASRHYQYDGDVEGDDDDDDDPVVQAISALGESVMDLGRRTRSSIAHGIQSIGRLGRRRPEGTAAAGATAAGGGDSSPSHRNSPAASADAAGRGLELVPGAASQTGGAIPLPSPSPRGPAGAADSGRASPAAFAAEAGAAAAGAGGAPGAAAAAAGRRVRVLKPVADAVSAVVGGARDAARDIRELREGSGGAFERMRDDEEEGRAGGGRRAGPEGCRGSGEGEGETDSSWAQGGEDTGAESEGGADAEPAVGIGAAAGAAAQPVPHGSDATRRPRRPTGARRGQGAAGEGSGAEGAASGSESDGRGGQRYRAGDAGSAAGSGASDAAGGEPQPVPGAVTYPAAARRYSRRGRRSTAMYSRTSVPLPNSLVVSAGIEGLTTVTVAAIRKLFAPGGEGSTIAGTVLSTAPPGSGAAAAAGGVGAGVGPEYQPRGAGAASAPPGSIAVSVGSLPTARMGGGAASAGAGGASSPPFPMLLAPSASAAADADGGTGADGPQPGAAARAAGEAAFGDAGAGGV